jgi:hypothetical protein
MRCSFAMAYILTLHLRRRLGRDKHSSPEQGRGGEKPAAVTTAIRCCVCMTKCRSGTWEREVKIGTELKLAPFLIDSCDPVEFDLWFTHLCRAPAGGFVRSPLSSRLYLLCR